MNASAFASNLRWFPPQCGKDIRVLIPLWLIMVASTLTLMYLRQSSNPIWWLLHLFGFTAMGALILGHEFTSNTLPVLFSQPISRNRIWRQKMMVLAIALFTVALLDSIFWIWPRERFSVGIEDIKDLCFMLWLPAVCIFCTAPFWTLLTRHVIGAIAFTMVTPPLLMFIAGIIGSEFLKPYISIVPSTSVFFDVYFTGENVLKDLSWALSGVLMLGYCLLSYLFAYRQFMQLEMTDSTPINLTWPRFLCFSKSRTSTGTGAVRRSAWRTLVIKELHLQKWTIFLAVLFITPWIITRVAGIHSNKELLCMAFLCSGVTFFCPSLLAGALTCAEERGLKTHAVQLALPVSTAWQWAIKTGVAFSVSLIFGLVMQLLFFIGPYRTQELFGPHNDATFIIVWFTLWVTSLAMAVSSISHSTTKSFFAAVLLGVGFYALSVYATPLKRIYRNDFYRYVFFQIPIKLGLFIQLISLWNNLVVFYTIGLGTILVNSWLAYKCYRQEQPRVTAMILLIFLVNIFIAVLHLPPLTLLMKFLP